MRLIDRPVVEHIVFSDLDAGLNVHPLTREIKPKTNREAIKRSLIHLMNWEPWDVPFQPELKSNIRELLFDIPNWTTTVVISDNIKWLINTFEKRIDLVDVIVTPTHSEDGVDITIKYIVISTGEPDSLNYNITRVR